MLEARLRRIGGNSGQPFVEPVIDGSHDMNILRVAAHPGFGPGGHVKLTHQVSPARIGHLASHQGNQVLPIFPAEQLNDALTPCSEILMLLHAT